MKPHPSKPRYKGAEKPNRQPRRGKDRPLDLTPAHPAKGWTKWFLNVFFTALVPTAALWWWTLTMSTYHVNIASKATDVRLDGQPIRLSYRGGFEIPRLPLKQYRLQYRDDQGHDVELALHPSPFDNDATPLTIDGGSTKGSPAAEFVRGS